MYYTSFLICQSIIDFVLQINPIINTIMAHCVRARAMFDRSPLYYTFSIRLRFLHSNHWQCTAQSCFLNLVFIKKLITRVILYSKLIFLLVKFLSIVCLNTMNMVRSFKNFFALIYKLFIEL